MSETLPKPMPQSLWVDYVCTENVFRSNLAALWTGIFIERDLQPPEDVGWLGVDAYGEGVKRLGTLTKHNGFIGPLPQGYIDSRFSDISRWRYYPRQLEEGDLGPNNIVVALDDVERLHRFYAHCLMVISARTVDPCPGDVHTTSIETLKDTEFHVAQIARVIFNGLRLARRTMNLELFEQFITSYTQLGIFVANYNPKPLGVSKFGRR